MFCMKCGKELPDNATFCMNCGERVEKTSIEDNNNLEIVSQEEKEYPKKIIYERDKSTKDLIIITWVCAIFCIFIKQYFFSFVCLFLLMCIKISESKKKKKIKILNKCNGYFYYGNKIPWTCPFCGSKDYSAFVSTDYINTGSSRARVSDNINPLHPFTHTNVKNSNIGFNTAIQTGKLQCHRCGKIFE